jgi:hypothetical protein
MIKATIFETMGPRFSTLKSADDVKDLWVMLTNNFQVFVKTRLEKPPDDYIKKENLRTAYAEWCDAKDVLKRHPARESVVRDRGNLLDNLAASAYDASIKQFTATTSRKHRLHRFDACFGRAQKGAPRPRYYE